MVDRIDQNVGRLVGALEELGELDNTIFIFLSDNGASRARARSPARPRTTCICSRVTTSTPTTSASTTSVVRARLRTTRVAGPWRRARRSGSTRSTRTRAATRSRSASRGPRDCRSAGRSARSTRTSPICCRPCSTSSGSNARLSATGSRSRRSTARASPPRCRDPDAPSTHREQIYECNGHRGLYRDGWELVTLHQPLTPFSDEEWELYHLAEDPTELHNLAAAEPDRVRELAAAWEDGAWTDHIYPLDEGSSIKYLQRPERSAVYGEPVTIRRGTPTLERWRSVQLLWFRSLTITVDLDHHSADQGMLVAHGDQGAGYALYVLDGELFFVHNNGRGGMLTVSGGAMPDGVQAVAADLRATGGSAVGADPPGRRRGPGDPGRGADALRHRAVRRHRCRHRPALTRVVGDLRAFRTVPLYGRAALGHLHPRRTRPRRARRA